VGARDRELQVSDLEGGVAPRQWSISVGASRPPGGSGGGLLGAEVVLVWLRSRARRRKV
jgi:hypothetical protein